MHLIKVSVDKAVYEGNGASRDVRWDDDPRGLGLRIYPTGEKSFVLSYRAGGRKRLFTLGDYGVLTLSQARDMAKRKLGAILEGADPVLERRRAALGGTVRELIAAYLDRHAKVHKKTWKEDERRLNTYVAPAWGSLKASSITRGDVSALHTRVGKHSIYEANRMLEVLSKMFGLAKDWGVVAETFANPALGVKRFKEKSRDRWLTPEELPRLAAAIAQEPNIYVKAAIWLYLLTGVRKSELLSARWADIDWPRCELRLPETKSGNVHYVPLSSAALTILHSLPRISNNPFVLPGLREGQHLVNISKPWLRIRKNSQVSDLRLHDLRRTVGSWLAQRGNSLQLIGKVLNHADIGTTQIYARLAEDQARVALEQHGQVLLAAAQPKQNDAPVIGHAG